MANPYYQDNQTTIYHGDCRDILPQLDVKANCVLTDPPYNIFAVGRAENFDEMTNDKTSRYAFQQLFATWLLETTFKTDENSWLLIFGGWQTCDIVMQSIKENYKLHGVIVWDKVHFGLGNVLRHQHEFLWCASRGSQKANSHDLSDLQRVQRVPSAELLHIAEKPVALIDRIIAHFSNTGDLILDPFLGSGTTCYCAKKLGRYSIGIEIEEKHCEIAANRCRQTVMELGL